ncbi:CBS domain-containing protein, partial [Enterococcus faecium]|uniref:CBS domain-containing protein n=1 Tax=Enterococcus faecium TaxID=1352 RepID=UPI0030C85FBD
MFTKYDWIQDTTDQPLDSEGILQVKNWMTQNPFVATTEQTIREIAERMFQHEISSLPVVNQEKQPIAIVKAKSLLESLLNG